LQVVLPLVDEIEQLEQPIPQFLQTFVYEHKK